MLSRHGHKNCPVPICKSQTDSHSIHCGVSAQAILQEIENAKNNIDCEKSKECFSPAPKPLTEQATGKTANSNCRIGIHDYFSDIDWLLNTKCCTEFLGKSK